jgi:hypothetical protein
MDEHVKKILRIGFAAALVLFFVFIVDHKPDIDFEFGRSGEVLETTASANHTAKFAT